MRKTSGALKNIDVAYQVANTTARQLASSAKNKILFETSDPFLANNKFWEVYNENFSRILKEEDQRLAN